MRLALEIREQLSLDVVRLLPASNPQLREMPRADGSRRLELLTAAVDGVPGLEVDALSGEPGIRSARYGGDADATDQDRVNLLLSRLAEVPWERRTARFRCVIALGRATVPTPALVGSVAGMVQYESQGTEGFGYDPVFYLPSYGKTMAQLPLEEKNRISHRSDAVRKAVAVLNRLATSQD